MLNSADQSLRDMRLATPLVLLATLAVALFGAARLAVGPDALLLAAVAGFTLAAAGRAAPRGMLVALILAAGLWGVQLAFGALNAGAALSLGLIWVAGYCGGALASRQPGGAAVSRGLLGRALAALFPSGVAVALLPGGFTTLSPLLAVALAALILLVHQPLQRMMHQPLTGRAVCGALLAVVALALALAGRVDFAAATWLLGRLLAGPMLRPAVAAGFSPVWAAAGPLLVLPALLTFGEPLVVAFLPVAVGLVLWDHFGKDRAGGAVLPEGLELSSRMEAWHQLFLADINLETRELRLTRAGQAHFGTEGTVSLNDWLSRTPVQQVPEFLSFLRSAEPGSRADRLLDVKTAGPEDIQPLSVTLVGRRGPQVSLTLQPQTELEALRERVSGLEVAGASAILREERLLSLAAHELRTPVSILSMVGEELKEGGHWEDTGAMYETALSRLITVLDDLRAGSGDPLGRQRSSTFTPASMVEQLLDQAGPVAAGRGQTITTELPEASGDSLSGDAARIELVLSRMISATLRRPDTRSLRLTLSRLGTDTLVWVVSDDAPALSDTTANALFSPFATAGAAGSGADYEGLGLYTARKAALSLGGTLDWQPSAGGNRLIFTHPAQRAPATYRMSRDVG